MDSSRGGPLATFFERNQILMMQMKKWIMMACVMLSSGVMLAQEVKDSLKMVEYSDAHLKNAWGAKMRESNVHASVDLQTKYVWRGMEMMTQDATPVIFPSVSYSNWGWNLYVLGGTSLNGKYAEVDFGTSYTWKWVTVGLNDYYYPTTDGPKDNYFNWKNRSTGHWAEATITIAPEKLPVYLMVSNFFAGADKRVECDEEGNVVSSKQAYSTYAEVGGSYSFLHHHSVSGTVGCAMNKSCYNLYEKGFSCTNVELKYTYNIAFKKGWTLPVACAFITNPALKKCHVNCTLHFGF